MTTKYFSPLVGVAVILFLSAVSVAEAQTVVTECGTHVLRGDAVLGNDLDCSGRPQFESAITLERSSTLDLAGFTIVGQQFSGVVTSLRNCKVLGPGTIVGGKQGINGGRPRPRNVRVMGVTLRDQLSEGVTGKKVRITDSIIENAGSRGIFASKKVLMAGTTITGCCDTVQPDSGRVSFVRSHRRYGFDHHRQSDRPCVLR